MNSNDAHFLNVIQSRLFPGSETVQAFEPLNSYLKQCMFFIPRNNFIHFQIFRKLFLIFHRRITSQKIHANCFRLLNKIGYCVRAPSVYSIEQKRHKVVYKFVHDKKYTMLCVSLSNSDIRDQHVSHCFY